MTPKPVPPAPPQEFSHTRKPRITKTQVGLALAKELGALIDEVGENHPDLPSEILGYVKTMNARHPGWKSFWKEQVRRQQQKIAGSHPTQSETWTKI